MVLVEGCGDGVAGSLVADVDMISTDNQRAIEDAGLSFILGARIGEVPYVVEAWRREHPDEQIPDGQIFPSGGRPVPRTSAGTRSSTTTAVKPIARRPTPALKTIDAPSGAHQLDRIQDG
jgi:hypothetical protein